MAFSYKDWHNKKVASEVESWLNDYENFYNETATAYKNRAGQFQNADELRKSQQGTFDRINSLTNSAKKYRDYITANRDRFNSDSVNSVLEVLNGAIEGENSLDYLKKALDDEIIQWGNFSSEDEYNEQKRQIDLRENFDVASAMARAKELRQQLPQYMTSDELHSKYGGAQGAANAYMNRNPEAEKEYEQLLKDIEDYGKIQDSKNAMEETKQFANFDFDANEAEIEKWKTALKSAEKNLNKANSTFSWGQNQWETNEEKQEYIDMYKGDIEKAKDIIHRLEQDRKNATKYRDTIYYDSLMNAEDFKEYSLRGGAIENMVAPKNVEEENLDETDVQNIVKYSRENPDNLLVGNIYTYMTPNEVAIHDYILAKEGRNKSDEYLDAIENTLNQRKGTAKAKEILETESNILRGLKIGKQAIDTGFDQFGTGLGQLFSSDAVDTTATQYASSIINEELEDNPLGKVVYSSLTSVANMAPSILLSSVTGSPLAGTLLMGGTASGNAYKQALAEGMRKDKARGYSLLVGASEATLQYMLGGVGKLGGAKSLTNIGRKAISNIDNVLLRVGADIGISALGEGIEEGLQEVLNPIFRNMVFDENNEVKLFSKDVMYSAIVGAVVGMFMEGMSIAKTDIKFNNVGKSINVTNKTEKLIDKALELDTDTEAHKLALEMKEGEVKPNDVNVGELYVNFAKDGGDTSFVLEGQENQPVPDWYYEEDEDDGFLDFERGAYTGNDTTNNTGTRLSSELSELVDDFGELGIKAFDEFYTEGVDKPQYYAAFASYYNAGRNGTDISKVKSSYKDLLLHNQKEGAYLAGQLDAERSGKVANVNDKSYNINSETNSEGVNNNGEEGIHLRNGGEWFVGASTGGQIFRVEKGTGRIEGWDTNSRPADKRATSLTHGRAVSSFTLGLSNGTNAENVFVVEKKNYTPLMRKAEKKAQKRGLKVTFFAGDSIEFVNINDEIEYAMAYIEEDHVFIRADHNEYTSDQLMEHELGHDKIANGEINPDIVKDRIEEKFGKKGYDVVSDKYTKDYEGTGLNAEEI